MSFNFFCGLNHNKTDVIKMLVKNCGKLLNSKKIFDRFRFLSSNIVFNRQYGNNCGDVQNQPASKNDGSKTKLLQEIVQRIRFTGPLTVADYMKMVLTHPQYGFYMNQDVFGSKGHFTTSPEISQIFGELVAIWVLYQWLQLGGGKNLRVVELGPGRGTLMADICRVMAQFSETRNRCSFHLVEISSYLRQIQERNICQNLDAETSKTLEQYANDDGIYQSDTIHGQPIKWYRSLEQIDPDQSAYTIFVANEFFDAFPIHKFSKATNNEWRELLVDVESPNSNDTKLRWILANSETPASKLFVPKDQETLKNFKHYESSPQTLVFVEQIVNQLNKADGCFLICDYGYDDDRCDQRKTNRDTFRAFKSHQLWDPLREPGTADLTADVDFGAIRAQLHTKAHVFGAITQSTFLQKLGIQHRLQKLLEVTNDEQRRELQSGVQMLLEDMGQRFKFMAIFAQHSVQTPNWTPVCFE